MEFKLHENLWVCERTVGSIINGGEVVKNYLHICADLKPLTRVGNNKVTTSSFEESCLKVTMQNQHEGQIQIGAQIHLTCI